MSGDSPSSSAGGVNGEDAVKPETPLREASSSVAGAIESVLAASDTRHQQIAETLAHLRQRQQEAEDRLQHLEHEQHQVAETASTILNNQKTSARCYEEVTGALSRIREHQQAESERLKELEAQTQRLEQRIGDSIRHAVLIAAVAQSVAILAAVGVAVWLLG
jgi:chromosome segregation ATPase